MKCPTCGAWTQVLDTRDTKRRRQCANGHTFSTVEVLPEAIAKREHAASLRKARESAARWSRDVAIRRDPRPAGELAVEHRLSAARIRQIRSTGQR